MFTQKIKILLYLISSILIAFMLSVRSVESEVLPEVIKVKTPPTTDQLITFYALKHNVKESVMRKVISCESSYKVKAIGDGGKSFGLVQIHLPSHPYVSKEQAFDPNFALEFLASNLSKNKGKMWTCYRKYYS